MTDSIKPDRILLEGMVFQGKIGCLDFEKTTPQPFVIDVILYCPSLGATQSDRLEDTLDYSRVFSLVQGIVETSAINTIERLAGLIADRLLEAFVLPAAVDVTVRKPDAPIKGAFSAMGVAIYRTRAGRKLNGDSKLSQAYLSIGSNLGDRIDNLRGGLRDLIRDGSVDLLAASSLYETDPVGKTDQPKFLNAVVHVATALSPLQLLKRCQQTEKRFGRERNERWGARTLDIDLLTYEDFRLDTPELILPHPRMAKRAFVQIPLQELKTGRIEQTDGVRLTAMHWIDF